MNDFLHMGGYAFYVWGSYGVTFALLAIEVFVLIKRKREAKSVLGAVPLQPTYSQQQARELQNAPCRPTEDSPVDVLDVVAHAWCLVSHAGIKVALEKGVDETHACDK